MIDLAFHRLFLEAWKNVRFHKETCIPKFPDLWAVFLPAFPVSQWLFWQNLPNYSYGLAGDLELMFCRTCISHPTSFEIYRDSLILKNLECQELKMVPSNLRFVVILFNRFQKTGKITQSDCSVIKTVSGNGNFSPDASAVIGA